MANRHISGPGRGRGPKGVPQGPAGLPDYRLLPFQLPPRSITKPFFIADVRVSVLHRDNCSTYMNTSLS